MRRPTHYRIGSCALFIGSLMLISLAIVPRTEQYVRAEIPGRFWGSPALRAVNERISAAWGGAVVGIALRGLGR